MELESESKLEHTVGGDELNRIKEVKPLEQHLLEIILEDESRLVVDFSNKLETIRFGMLTDREFFKKAITDGSYIRWDNFIEISLTEAVQMAQK